MGILFILCLIILILYYIIKKYYGFAFYAFENSFCLSSTCKNVANCLFNLDLLTTPLALITIFCSLFN